MKVKLVRDRTPEIPRPANATGTRKFRIARSRSEKTAHLCAKLHEEAAEVADAPGDVYEYADLLEVMLELAKMNGLSLRLIVKAMLSKRLKKGGFRKGLILTVTK